jgi:uncharacterized protein (TIGR01777 family)
VRGAVAAYSAVGAGQCLEPAAFEGVDRVVHLAGETVAGRWTKKKKKAILESRVEGTRSLVESMAVLPSSERPKVLVSVSAVGFYGDRGDEELTEDSVAGSGFLTEVCQAWEGEAIRAEELGIRVVRARMGLVLANEAGALVEMLQTARWGIAGALGGGKQWWSWIHVDDAVCLLARLLADDAFAGPVNVTSPGPVTQGAFARALGKVLGRPSFLPAPAWVLRAALGEFSTEILASKRVLPARALEAGFDHRFKILDDALGDLLGGR